MHCNEFKLSIYKHIYILVPIAMYNHNHMLQLKSWRGGFMLFTIPRLFRQLVEWIRNIIWQPFAHSQRVGGGWGYAFERVGAQMNALQGSHCRSITKRGRCLQDMHQYCEGTYNTVSTSCQSINYISFRELIRLVPWIAGCQAFEI